MTNIKATMGVTRTVKYIFQRPNRSLSSTTTSSKQRDTSLQGSNKKVSHTLKTPPIEVSVPLSDESVVDSSNDDNHDVDDNPRLTRSRQTHVAVSAADMSDQPLPSPLPTSSPDLYPTHLDPQSPSNNHVHAHVHDHVHDIEPTSSHEENSRVIISRSNSSKQAALARVVSWAKIVGDGCRWTKEQAQQLAVAERELARCQKAWSSEQEVWLAYVCG